MTNSRGKKKKEKDTQTHRKRVVEGKKNTYTDKTTPHRRKEKKNKQLSKNIINHSYLCICKTIEEKKNKTSNVNKKRDKK